MININMASTEEVIEGAILRALNKVQDKVYEEVVLILFDADKDDVPGLLQSSFNKALRRDIAHLVRQRIKEVYQEDERNED